MNELNVYLQQFMARWAQLRPRERIGLIAAGSALALMLVYLMLWEPVVNEADRLKRAIEQNRELVSWMQAKEPEVRRLLGSGGAQRGGGSLLGTIDSTAKRSKLGDAMKRVEPDGSNRVRVWMEQASFDDMVRWLDQLQRSHGVQITSVVIDRVEGSSGLVNARFVFSGASS